MSINAGMFSSNTDHYCTPMNVIKPMRRLLVPKASGRRLIDPATNKFALTRPDLYCDGGEKSDGLTARWAAADAWFNNPPYGQSIPAWVDRQCYWGSIMPGISLLPARPDPAWAREIFTHADAWLFVEGRLTFWLPIPLHECDAAPVKKARTGKTKGPYFLRRWHPNATEANLPAPFRLVGPGLIVGPELGENGKPQAAPFPSMLAFWADKNAEDQDPADEREALRELVRTAVESVTGDDAWIEGGAEWLAEADRLLGSKYICEDGPLDRAPFERLALAAGVVPDYPITCREFGRHFMQPGKLTGTLTVRTGRHRGVYTR